MRAMQESQGERVPVVTLNDGRTMPGFGLGMYKVSEREVEEVLSSAFAAGYRLIDTAAMYGNERAIGQAIRRLSLSRSEVYVTSKLWNDMHGYDTALRAFDQTIANLGFDYLDLYLIHWPAPSRGLYPETWRALVRLKEEGRVRSIGVSNFTKAHLEKVIAETGVVPAVNQIELHPQLPQLELRSYHAQHEIITEAWSPLARGALLQSLPVTKCAEKYGKTAAQIVLRWHLQQGIVAIPKSSSQKRIFENIQLFDFELDSEDMESLQQLATGERVGPHPDAVP